MVGTNVTTFIWLTQTNGLQPKAKLVWLWNLLLLLFFFFFENHFGRVCCRHHKNRKTNSFTKNSHIFCFSIVFILWAASLKDIKIIIVMFIYVYVCGNGKSKLNALYFVRIVGLRFLASNAHWSHCMHEKTKIILKNVRTMHSFYRACRHIALHYIAQVYSKICVHFFFFLNFRLKVLWTTTSKSRRKTLAHWSVSHYRML